MKINKSSIGTDNKYIANLYPLSGIFINIDNNDLKEVFYVNRSNKTVLFLGANDSDFKIFETYIENEPIIKDALTELVSESFVLDLIKALK